MSVGYHPEPYLEAESWNAFRDYVSCHAFVHDDFQPDLIGEDGVHDWDQFGSNALLIGADVCVVDSLVGFGDAYLSYLAELGCVASEMIVPTPTGPSMLENLLDDVSAMGKFSSIVTSRGLDVSPFYADSSKPFGRLLGCLGLSGHQSKLDPNQDLFIYANSKANARVIFRRAGVEVPFGRFCTSQDDLREFSRSMFARGASVVLKRAHWQAQHVSSPGELDALDHTQLPVVAEMVYRVKASPVVQLLRWNDRVYPLGIMAQHIVDFRHRGNDLPSGIGEDMERTLWRMAERIAGEIGDYLGVLGIDFIITPDGRVLAVDLNPRFNSSTYPLAFLARSGVDFKRVHAKVRWVHARLRDLSQLFSNPTWSPFDRSSAEGVLPFGPVTGPSRERVIRFMYMAVASTYDGMARLERDFQKAVAQEQASLEKHDGFSH